MTEVEPEEMVRSTVYIPKKDKRALKAALALEGVNLSEWVRQKIVEKLSKP